MTERLAIVTGASRGLGRSMALQLARRGVSDYLTTTISLGRVGQPDDVLRAVAALLSDDFAWANGARIEVSGGQLL